MATGETVLNERYRLVSQLASGGMAVVYKAVDDLLGRTVAIKVLRPSLTADPAFVNRFKNEARSIANLSHPNIVTVHDVGSDGPTHYIVMELVDGSDLKKLVRTHGALPIERALNLAIQLCDGIGFAHRAGIVHADVKPQNVLLTRDDLVKITDFGIAQALSDTQPSERASVVWGSPHYFAPEQAQGEKPTTAADVYSIGVVLFEMLTGRLPYTGANQQELAMAHVKSPVPSVRDFNTSIPQELADTIRKVMKKHPNDRFSQADQLGNVLRAIKQRYQGQGSAAQPSSPGPPADLPESQPQPPAGTPGEGAGRSSTEATSRYGAVPQAPGYREQSGQGGQTPPPPSRGGGTNASEHPRAFTMSPRGGEAQRPVPPSGDSQRIPYNQQVPPDEDATFRLDVVTIALGVLAFMSVACLIPLYIAAFSALGG